MNNTKIGLVTLVTESDPGSWRSEFVASKISEKLQDINAEIIVASKIVKSPADAIEMCNELKKDNVDGLIMIDINWIPDSLQYIFIHELNLPTLLWALPYNESYSIACVHHFGTTIKSHGIHYEYVHGMPEDDGVIEKAITFINAVCILKATRSMRIALLGPRETWRVAGPQDMTKEELDFSLKLGPTIIHIEMTELLKEAESVSDENAKDILRGLLERTGTIEVDENVMLNMAKVYVATKNIMRRYNVNAVAAETVPQYCGSMNLPSSWLADEGIIVDTEGDISHTMVMYMLNMCSSGGATFLGEICSIKDNNLYLYHEGSSAHSLAEDIKDVHIRRQTAKGTKIGLSMKQTEIVTIASIVGSDKNYKMLIGNGIVNHTSQDELAECGTGCLAKLDLGIKGDKVLDYLMNAGLDHHMLVKEGDYSALMSMLCKFMKIEEVNIPDNL